MTKFKAGGKDRSATHTHGPRRDEGDAWLNRYGWWAIALLAVLALANMASFPPL